MGSPCSSRLCEIRVFQLDKRSIFRTLGLPTPFSHALSSDIHSNLLTLLHSCREKPWWPCSEVPRRNFVDCTTRLWSVARPRRQNASPARFHNDGQSSGPSPICQGCMASYRYISLHLEYILFFSASIVIHVQPFFFMSGQSQLVTHPRIDSLSGEFWLLVRDFLSEILSNEERMI